MPLNPWLVASYAAAGAIDILAPLALAVFLARRLGGRWRYWAIGVLVFLLSQAVTRVPAMIWFQTLPSVQAVLKQPVWSWLFFFFAAFTAGLFEEGGRWLAFRFLVPPGERSWRTALMLGAGHGGLESVLLGGLALLAALAFYLALVYLPPETFGAAKTQLEPLRAEFIGLQGWEPLLGAWERCCALLIQLALTVLVVQAFLRGRRRWWWYALGAHTLVDFTVIGLMSVVVKRWGTQVGAGLTEGLVGVFAVLSLWIIFALRPREKVVTRAEAPADPSPDPAQP